MNETKQKAPRGFAKLKKALTEDLEARGLGGQIYTDKVAEYLDLWKRRQALKEDIELRGVTVMDEKRGMEVENRSVSLEVQVSKQMLSIWTALGFKDRASDCPLPKGDDDDL